jgi:tetratricopeptide (TPR) repeat protein
MSNVSEHETVLQAARQHLRQREYPQALALYEQVVAKEPTSVTAHEGAATAAFVMQDYPRAIEHFKRAGQLDPRKAQPLVNLGAVYNRMAEFQTAAKVLRQAIGKDRRCAEAYYNLGIAHRGLNQTSMAVSAYKEAIRLAPEMAEAYQNLGNLYVEMGNTQQAILNYKRALEIRPDFERAQRGLERAQNAAVEAKRSISPFGRLVGSGGPTDKDVEPAAMRALTPQERFEDRALVHSHAKEMERAAAVLLNQMREQLEGALLQLTHAFTQSDDRYNFKAEFATFQRARDAFGQVVKVLTERSDALRDHEKLIRS